MENESNKIIGRKIHLRREELNMTQQQLAEALEITPQAISLWENGKSVPSTARLGQLAKALRMSKEDLISDEIRNTPTWIINDQFFSEQNMYRKLKEFATAERLRDTNHAIDYSLEKHKEQERKQSEAVPSNGKIPLIVHPFTMACHAHAIGIRDDVVLATALLHDVPGKCNVSVYALGAMFSDEVTEAVRRLTKPKQMDNEQYYERIRGNSTAEIVKVIERCNNLSTIMAAFSEQEIIDYIEETEDYVLPLLEHIKKNYPQYYDQVFILKYQMMGILESIKAAIIRL